MQVAFSQLKGILKTSVDVITCTGADGKFTLVSDSAFKLFGYLPEEMVGRSAGDFIHPDDRDKTSVLRGKILAGMKAQNFENRFIRKDGTVVDVEWSAVWSEQDKTVYGMARDATQKKLYEAHLKRSENQYRLLFLLNPMPMWLYDISNYKFLEVNEAAIRHYGYSREEFLSMSILDIRPQEEVEKVKEVKRQIINKVEVYNGNWRHLKKNGELIDVEITSHQVDYKDTKAALVLVYDITEKLRAERELLASNERFEYVNKATFDVIWDWNLLTKEVFWGEKYQEIFGHPLTDDRRNPALWGERIHDEDRKKVLDGINEAITERLPSWSAEYRYLRSNGTYAHVIDKAVLVFDNNHLPVRMVGAMQDISRLKETELALKDANDKLEKRAKELAYSNAELERFAYVASHDLQEPLRMVSSFLQLLQKKFKDQLDSTAEQYIHYAVDGSERMKILINDLLDFSRIGKKDDTRDQVDLNGVVKRVLGFFQKEISESHADIQVDSLPTISANASQMQQLMQNLVGNAVKYRQEGRQLQIRIGVEEKETEWLFFIKDNGIGIDAKFYDKIFIIFKRLHNKEEYSGTGIGLAVCKKIVERHGGHIWLESKPGEGSTFFFTIKRGI